MPGLLHDPGKPDVSLLLQVLTGSHPDIARMPRRADPFSGEQLRLVRAWIGAGAPWPDPPDGAPAKTVPHWAFVPPIRPAVPPLESGSGSPVHPIDAFVRTALSSHGLAPALQAAPIDLLRRLHLDLIGLPPTLEEVDRFLAADPATALSEMVERLLASPHYGERWGRHWLDAARYADSDGFEKDKPRSVGFAGIG